MTRASKKPILNDLIIYSDGSTIKNPGPGACACLLFRPDKKPTEFTRFFPHTTSNRAEMLGPLLILESLETAHRVTIYSDSMYLVSGLSRGIQKWKKSYTKWINLPNKDLWQRYETMMIFHDIKTLWVPSHSGHPENEYVDNLARKVAQVNYERIKRDESKQKKVR